MRKLGLVLALALAASVANAQTVVQNTLSGNETWSAGQGAGGPSGYVTANLMRGGAPHVLTTITGATTLGTGATAAVNWGGNILVSAQPSAAVITLPANPVPDGAIIGVCNVTGSAFATNAVTLAANTGQTLSVAATLTTLGAGVCAQEQFHRATTTWYRVQ